MPEARTETEPTPEGEKQDGETGESLAGKLVGVGGETVKRLYDELERNERAREAFEGARGQFERFGRSALQQLGIAPLDELNELRGQVGRLEARVRVLEGDGESAPEDDAPAGGEAQAGDAA